MRRFAPLLTFESHRAQRQGAVSKCPEII